tara:strand:- start:13942 stop:14898 length:957 start_codon:yes stop_codon:yes gene_type:complete
MIYLEDGEVSKLLENKWDQIIESIESAFVDPTADMVPKVYLKAGNAGDYRAMPAALGGYAALKWIGVFPNNPKGDNPMGKKLPTTIGTLILNDRFTGLPLLAMDCTTLTAYRTAATSAIAAKYCAPEAEGFAFIGCGLQAKYHIEAYEAIFSHTKMDIQLYDKNEKTQKDLFNWLGSQNLCRAWGRNKSVKEAVKDAHIITTLTPSTEAYLDIFDIPNNCHINAVGADAVGKRELMTNVIDGAADIICDDSVQAKHSGELQYSEWPYLDIKSLYDVIKHHDAMQLERGLSVFDSTGVAIEDIAIATLIYQLYYEKNNT